MTDTTDFCQRVTDYGLAVSMLRTCCGLAMGK